MWLTRYLLGVPLILFLSGIAAGSDALVGIAVLLLLAGVVARYWSKHALDRVSYRRIIPENRAFAGDQMSLTLRLANDKLLPVPLVEVRDPFPEGILQNEAHLTPAPFPNYVLLNRRSHLGWNERINWPLRFEAPPRGHYRIGPARLSAGDIFGFFPVTREDEQTDALIVYPRTYTLPELGLPSERPFGERKGRDRIFEDPGRVAGLRDYQPGDAMRRIDWKASARRQALQSRVYEPSSTLHLLVALNVHTLTHTWEGYIPELLERLLSTAGSVARYGFEAGYSIGITANGSYPGSDRPLRVPIGRSDDQLMRVLEALAVINPLTLAPLRTILANEAQSFPYGATLVCVTALMDEELAASLQRIADAGHSVTVLSLAEEEFEINLGRVRLHNLSKTMKSLELRAGQAPQEEAAP